MYQYFIWNGINSLDMGVVMLKAPSIFMPERRVNEIEIAGRNGILHEDTGTFANYTKDAECHVMDREQIDKVCQWLTGAGEVIFSSEPDRVYRAFIKNSIPFNNVLRNMNDFLVQFDCFPFKYSVNWQDEVLTLTKATTLFNKGSFASEPIMTVYGTGDVVLNVNGKEYTLEGVDSFVTINTEMMEVYKNDENKNSFFTSDDFPVFEVGENAINWTGNVEKIEIQPNWRWL